MGVLIETKQNHPRELQVKQTLIEILQRFPHLPLYTEQIRIAFLEHAHSHPVLTINTFDLDWRSILRQFVHEQMHWFKMNDPETRVAREYLGKKYTAPDISEFSEHHGTREQSFIEHIIVCWNTENIMRKYLNKEDLQYIYVRGGYPKMEYMVRDNFDEIQSDLRKFDLVAS